MYYMRVAGKTYGPYPFQQLQEFITQGRLTPQSEVSNDGQNWFQANTVPGLFGVQPAPQLPPGFQQQGQQSNPYTTPMGYDRPMTSDPSIDPNRSFFGYYKDIWRKSTVNSGRSRRKEYWAWSVFNSLILCPIAFVLGFCLAAMDASGGEPSPALAIAFLGCMVLLFGFFLATILPGINLMVRRLHDMNLSGWLCLLAFIPYVGPLFSLIIGCIDGTVGPNGYGHDPKGRM